jgi:hypothetical protein
MTRLTPLYHFVEIMKKVRKFFFDWGILSTNDSGIGVANDALDYFCRQGIQCNTRCRILLPYYMRKWKGNFIFVLTHSLTFGLVVFILFQSFIH